MNLETVMVLVFSLVILLLLACFFLFLAVMVVAVSADSVLSLFGIRWLNDKDPLDTPETEEDARETSLSNQCDDLYDRLDIAKSTEVDLDAVINHQAKENKNA